MIMNNKPDFYKVNHNHEKIAGLYNIGKTIGRGHFAVVKEAKHVFTEEKVAIKIIDKTKLDSQSRDYLFSEVMCMKLVQHPNIVRLYEVIDTVNKLYLVLELGDAGDLYDYIMKHENGLPEMQAKCYFRQIVEAISYCHNLHVVHRDLKPENVVFFEKLELVKLTDFGFSNKFTPGETLQTSCGSLAYSAPEILLGDPYDAPKVDIWSLGVILFMLVCGRLPFDETNDSETLSRIMDCRYELPSRLSVACQSFIRTMLVRVPSERASLEEILDSEWLDGGERQSLSVPLISQQELSVEEHVDILTKMSEGNLASVEEIQTTLDRREYSYITATYFLLAERKLKRRQYEQFCRWKQLLSSLQSETIAVDNNNVVVVNNEKPVAVENIEETKVRRFSMILEDEEEEDEEKQQVTEEEELEELQAMISLVSVREELPLTTGKDLERDSPKLRSTIYHSKSLTSIIDRQSIKLRHNRQSLPRQPLSSSSLLPIAANNRKRRSFPSPNHSNSDISDNESVLLRGLIDKKRTSVPKSFGRQSFLSQRHSSSSYKPPLSPDWINNSNSSIESDSSYRCSSYNQYQQHHLHCAPSMSGRRRIRLKSSSSNNSRPNSLGAMLTGFSTGSDDDGDSCSYQRPPQMSLSNSPTTVTTVAALHRDICAPIDEEEDDDEHIQRSRSFVDNDNSNRLMTDRGAHCLHSFRSVSIDCRPQSSSFSSSESAVRWTAATQNRLQHINNDNRLTTQSTFSLSSFASGLRDSATMMNVVRGAFELQCLANRIQSNGGRQRYEFSSVTSLPVERKVNSPDDSVIAVVVKEQPETPTVAIIDNSQESLLTKCNTKTSLSNHGGVLIRASHTVGRKARFILSCCRTS